MISRDPNYQFALNDFNNARRKASIQEILARLQGKSSELLSYDEVARKLKLNVRTERGVYEIPLDSIVGSVGRYHEFTRDFMPLKNEDQERWARVKAAVDDPIGVGLDPIDVYKVGDAYFVLDGNHRVSIARQEGSKFIDAHVIEVKTDIPVAPDIQPDDLIIKAEYAEFLEKTEFASIRPGVDLSVSVPGQYGKLIEHIQVHKYFMGIDFQRDVSYAEAVGHWYDTVYSSITEPVRERGLLRWFPGRTETDIYLWVSEYRANLEGELGWTIKPEAAAINLASKENPDSSLTETGRWRMSKMVDRYTDRLFGEILVPLTGVEASWLALEQAILVAGKESSVLHGLHVVPVGNTHDENELRSIRERFTQRCDEANIQGNLISEEGNVPQKVTQRALLTDLISLHVAHPPSTGLSSLQSGLRTIIRNSARPILTVSDKVSPMDSALLAFDGSVKSKEALFVATYLAERWKTRLVVLTVSPNSQNKVQDYARSYLDLHEILPEYVVKAGSRDVFLKIIEEHRINLVVMGSYSGTTLKEVVVGSAVNYLLRATNCSLLICR